jgi:hypothetical protein
MKKIILRLIVVPKIKHKKNIVQAFAKFFLKCKRNTKFNSEYFLYYRIIVGITLIQEKIELVY